MIKIGDKVRCIENDRKGITKNKIYEVLEIETDGWKVPLLIIRNDNGDKVSFFEYVFKLEH